MKKVLLTSGSKTFLNRNSTLLMDKGFLFFTSTRGAEALTLHEEHHFDLIIADFKLEDMDGCRLCSEVRSREKPHLVPVIIICHDTVEHLEKVKQSAASAILLKPINPTHLLITIGSFIDMQLARCKRVIFNAAVLCKKLELEFLGNSHDISTSGILLETEYQLGLGNRINCQFSLPDTGQIQLTGEVARYVIEPDGRKFYGIKFMDPPLSSRNTINRYVASFSHLGIRQKPHGQLERSINLIVQQPPRN